MAAMALAGLAAPAHAATVMDPPNGAYPYQRWVEQARVPTPDVVLRLIEEPCPAALAGFANACTAPNTFTVWMNPETADRATFYHELGHNFDYYELGRWASRQFRRIIGDDRRWRTKPGEVGLSPHEIFAEAYSVCARKRTISRAIIELPPIRIGPAQHEAICNLIRVSYKLQPPRPSAAAPATAPPDI